MIPSKGSSPDIGFYPYRFVRRTRTGDESGSMLVLLKRAKKISTGVFFLAILTLSVCSTSSAQEPRTSPNESIEMFFVAVALIGVAFFIRRLLRW
jgi:hypothetical protein